MMGLFRKCPPPCVDVVFMTPPTPLPPPPPPKPIPNETRLRVDLADADVLKALIAANLTPTGVDGEWDMYISNSHSMTDQTSVTFTYRVK